MIAALLLALGYWTYGAVERSLREIRGATMRSLVVTHAVAPRAARRAPRGARGGHARPLSRAR